MLTDTKVRAAKPRPKPYKLTDTSSLYLLVTPSGGKLWRWNYEYDGKQKSMAFGAYHGSLSPLVCVEQHRHAIVHWPDRVIAVGHDARIDRSKLQQQPKLPSSYDVVAPDGTVNTVRIAEIHRWAVPTFDVLNQFEAGGGNSLTVPTWHYPWSGLRTLGPREAAQPGAPRRRLTAWIDDVKDGFEGKSGRFGALHAWTRSAACLIL